MLLKRNRLAGWACIVLLTFAAMVAGCGNTEDRKAEYFENATKYYEEGRLDDAMIEVKNAIRLDNKFVEAHVLKGEIHFTRQQWRDAFGSWTRALDLDPGLDEVKVNIGKLYMLGGDIEEAEKRVTEVLEKDPSMVAARLLLAAVRARQEKYDEAASILEELLQTAPENSDVYPLLASVYTRQGREEEAVELLEKGVGQVNDPMILRLQLVNYYAADKEYGKAEAILLELREEKPEENKFVEYLVKLYMEMGQQEKAVALLQSELQKRGDSEELRIQLANLYERLEERDKAKDVLQAGITGDEAAYGLRFKLAEIHLAEGEVDKARAIFDKIIEIDPLHPRSIDARRGLAQILLREGKTDLALQEFDAVLEQNPEDVMSQYFKGRILMGRGEFNDAILLLRQVVHDKPDLRDAYSLLAQAHFLIGEQSMAEEVLRSALDNNPGYDEARMELIRLYVRTDQREKALQQADQLAASLDKEGAAANPEVLAFLGDLYAGMGRPEKAENFYGLLGENKEAAPLGIYKTGRLFALQGDLPKAIETFKKGLEQFPGNALLFEALVMAHLQNDDKDIARGLIRDNLEKYPENAMLHELDGRVLQTLGETDQAMDAYMKAIEANPTWALPYTRLAGLYQNTGRLDEGLENFEKLYAGNPDFKGLAFLIAVLRQMNGQYDLAEQRYREVLSGEGEFAPAMNNLAYLLIEHNPTPERLQEALALAGKAVEAGKTPNTLDTLGMVQLALGEKAKGLKNIHEAWKMTPDNPEIAYHYALALEQTGSRDMAKEVLQEIASEGLGEPLAGKIAELKAEVEKPVQAQ